MSDLAVARLMGWRYEWVRALPVYVYEILMQELNKPNGR